MKNRAKYKFKIEGFTPDTMPLCRLLDYYRAVNGLLGNRDGVHLKEIRQGSHVGVFEVDPNVKPEVDQCLKDILAGSASNKKEAAARKQIETLLIEDGVNGSLEDVEGMIRLDWRGGDESPKAKAEVTVKELATLTGELYRIIGDRDPISIGIKSDEYGKVQCRAGKSTAKEMAKHLFKLIKITGIGTWTRKGDGLWEVRDLEITGFSPVSENSLWQTVEQIRNLDISWPDDPLKVISDLMDEDGAH